MSKATNQHTPETFHTAPLVRRKGSTAGIIGVDPLAAQILRRTGTDSTVIANISNAGATVGSDSFVSTSRPDLTKRVAGDIGPGQGISKDRKWVVSGPPGHLIRLYGVADYDAITEREFHFSVDL